MLSIKFSNVTKLRINNYIINEYNYILYKSLYCNLKLYSFFCAQLIKMKNISNIFLKIIGLYDFNSFSENPSAKIICICLKKVANI